MSDQSQARIHSDQSQTRVHSNQSHPNPRAHSDQSQARVHSETSFSGEQNVIKVIPSKSTSGQGQQISSAQKKLLLQSEKENFLQLQSDLYLNKIRTQEQRIQQSTEVRIEIHDASDENVRWPHELLLRRQLLKVREMMDEGAELLHGAIMRLIEYDLTKFVKTGKIPKTESFSSLKMGGKKVRNKIQTLQTCNELLRVEIDNVKENYNNMVAQHPRIRIDSVLNNSIGDLRRLQNPSKFYAEMRWLFDVGVYPFLKTLLVYLQRKELVEEMLMTSGVSSRLNRLWLIRRETKQIFQVSLEIHFAMEELEFGDNAFITRFNFL